MFTKINFWTNTYQIQNEFFKRAIIQQATWHHLDTCILKLQLSMQHSAINCKINQIMKLSQCHCSLQQLLRACHLLPYFAQTGYSCGLHFPRSLLRNTCLQWQVPQGICTISHKHYITYSHIICIYCKGRIELCLLSSDTLYEKSRCLKAISSAESNIDTWLLLFPY